jgi:hypothetical protein
MGDGTLRLERRCPLMVSLTGSSRASRAGLQVSGDMADVRGTSVSRSLVLVAPATRSAVRPARRCRRSAAVIASAASRSWTRSMVTPANLAPVAARIRRWLRRRIVWSQSPTALISRGFATSGRRRGLGPRGMTAPPVALW